MFITFTRIESEYLDNISNGFLMNPHEVRFNPNILNIIEKSIAMWNDCDFQMSIVREIRELYARRGAVDENFLQELVVIFEGDRAFPANLGFLFQQARAEIKMKCFTEIRDNQKLSRYHCVGFGEYGIMMKRDWMVEVGGSPVIYANREHSIVQILARNQAMLAVLESSHQAHTRRIRFATIGCFIDILSFIQEADHYGEYEWRVVSKSNIGPHSFFPERDRVNFDINDVHSFFVPNEEAKARLAAHLRETFRDAMTFPEIFLTEEIVISEEDERTIERLTTRTFPN